MRVLTKIMIVGLLALLTTAAIGLYWLDFYSSDLPNIDQLAQFAPSQAGKATLECTPRQVNVIPYSSLGNNLILAFRAAEGGSSYTTGKYHPSISWRIALRLFCQPSPELNQQLRELRTSIQLNRRYSSDQLTAIYLNGAYFGDDIWGAQTVAHNFFHKDSNDLGPPEAALLAGMIRSPAYYSPIKHPDRALGRRNEVLDAMTAAGNISATNAATAKMSSLLPAQ